MSHPAVFHPLQQRFLALPQTPLCYWLRERFFELLAGRTLGDVADVVTGLQTSNDARFVRFTWEAPLSEWAQPVRQRRWAPFEKGGGYGKWFGHHFWVVDWQYGGARIKASPTAVVRNEGSYFREGWTYSYMARGSLGVRQLDGDVISSHLASAIFFSHHTEGGATVTNCRFASVVIRSISAKIQLNESYVARVPFPASVPALCAQLEPACIALKRHLVARDPTERAFLPSPPAPLPLAGAAWPPGWGEGQGEGVAAVLHTLEGLSEREVFAAYGIAGDDLAAVLEETGTPAGWQPLLRGYDAIPPLPPELALPPAVVTLLPAVPRTTLAGAALATVKQRLRALYEAGPGSTRAEEQDERGAAGDGADDEEAVVTLGAHLPIPPETFLEELSQKVRIHPLSVYWLLAELRREGVRCQPEERRQLEDRLSVLTLRLLGHRWPRQVEAGEPLPAWAEAGGIIPLVKTGGHATLAERLRAQLRAEDGDLGAQRMEALLSDVTGLSLEEWLRQQFFRRHISQFRRRPIVWHLASRPLSPAYKRGRRSSRPPAFECFLSYHACSSDILARLRTQYVEPLLQQLRARAEEDRQQQRESETGEQVQELDAFVTALRQVEDAGFACPELERLAATEPLDRWSGDGLQQSASREALIHQERCWRVNLHDGVRVNIAPLQRAGLLATAVLQPADVEKAIVERARWRAEERRLVREGKLPRCSWMPERVPASERWSG